MCVYLLRMLPQIFHKTRLTFCLTQLFGHVRSWQLPPLHSIFASSNAFAWLSLTKHANTYTCACVCISAQNYNYYEILENVFRAEPRPRSLFGCQRQRQPFNTFTTKPNAKRLQTGPKPKASPPAPNQATTPCRILTLSVLKAERRGFYLAFA